jgi:hypothetical protein
MLYLVSKKTTEKNASVCMCWVLRGTRKRKDRNNNSKANNNIENKQTNNKKKRKIVKQKQK